MNTPPALLAAAILFWGWQTGQWVPAVVCTILVEAEAAKEMARRAAREEGMLIGLSSGATLAAIAQKLAELPQGTKVIGFNYDSGERYLSVEGFLPAQ